ncbi:CCHC-type Zinc finger, nucleic acid binding protein a [Plakobranchus ocellatus]|uniref:CCHC-type Zinc finger, nucleic acid binding protein a n=1 Tax=Plakobranchus ocellatus TaxID=259542 RepID=A0AAV4A5D4_9GAST|nr:CCHC-type Zinc finger, nucleic acid binding protein a [Plakobranchus ocellatus]
MLVRHKIRHEMSAPYSQHQNGKAERAWRTLFEMARCLLTDSGLPKFLWSYAVLATAYIRNRCIHTKIDCTPFQAVTGYGPSANRTFRILFDGDERKFSLWETKFLGFMRVRNLHSVFKDLSNQDTPVDANKNEEAYAELVQVLDDRSLSLIIRDAHDDGQKALQILRNHYRPTGKPRVITLYTELMSLIKLKHESITDYIILAETSAASLRDAGEKVSDSLLISMVLKGLPTDYQPFVTVITQKEEELTFQEFKVALRNHEDTEEISRQHMNSSSKPSSSAIMSYKHKRWCQNCKSSTHDTNFCRKTQPPRQTTQTPTTRKWCDHCQSKTHFTKDCRKLSKLRTVKDSSDSDDHFTFHISDSAYECDSATSDCDVAAKLLVDSGASCHIITDKDNNSLCPSAWLNIAQQVDYN